ncbi:replication protein A 70 kDa DNA-binding subunit B [Tanacetum coccineum]
MYTHVEVCLSGLNWNEKPQANGSFRLEKATFTIFSGEQLGRKHVYSCRDKMSQEITPVSDIDPMMDEGNVLVRCISIWYNHPPGKPEMKWGLEMILQDEQGNRIQASVKKDGLSKFQPILQEGSCYKISNFGVGENGGKFPLLSHKYRINFYKNTSVTRVNKFDNNVHGFKFEPFQNFATKHFSPTDVVDVIGTVVSISDLIPFSGGLDQEKRRRTILLEDVDGLQMECCFFDGWADRFNTLAEHRETVGHVVLILQLARVKYFNGKPSIGNAIVSTKIYNNAEIPEIVAFRRRYQEIPGYDEKNHTISLWSPAKKEITPEMFFSGAVKKMIGNIRDSDYCVGSAIRGGCLKELQTICYDQEEGQTYACKIHKGMSSVVPKYKVIIRVIDDTGSASLLLYEDMIMQLINVPQVKKDFCVREFGASSSKEQSIGISSINEKEKRVVIDLENYAEDESDAKKAKKSMVQVKVEKEDE